VLRVRGVFAEPHADPSLVAIELAEELRLLCAWLDRVSVARRGDLAAPLGSALA
jgi:hypothetical protein